MPTSSPIDATKIWPLRGNHGIVAIVVVRIASSVVAACLLFLVPLPASALDKQGSAHGGDVEGATSGFAVAGSAALGSAFYNPTYAARPNNTGLVLFRVAGHLDIDLIGRRLSIPIDVNLFTDRTARPGARFLVPSEVDIIGGVMSTWRLGPGAIEGGARVEHDRGLDPGGYPNTSMTANKQSFVDVRVRYLMSLAAVAPDAARRLSNGDVSGWLTAGWFAFNRAYFARPNNTGFALFRYAAHVELAVWDKRLALGVDTSMFTDRRAANVAGPSELDLTTELVFRPWGADRSELHLAYERDMPVDRGGLVQQHAYVLAVVPFEIVEPSAPPSSSD